MKDPRTLLCCAGLVFLLAGCQGGTRPEPEPDKLELNGQAYHVRGPFTHENMAVFLLTSDHQDERDYLTLGEGLEGGLVKVAEQEQERVGELRLENLSDRPLYLQEGERLQGGKQDRVLISSLVVPPRSGKVTVPTMCVEQSRWVVGEKGREFGFTVNPALAPKGVRGAAKVEESQDMVWTCVACQKVTAGKQLKTGNTNSSVNELLDAPQVRTISDNYAKALGSALDGPEARDAVGVAIVVNGQIEETNVYPNHALFAKLYPRLVQSYAVQATMLKDQAKAAEAPTTATVVRFLEARGEKAARDKSLDTHNKVQISELDDNKFQCTTRYDGQVIHWQIMKKNGVGHTARAGALGNDW
jgi:hypothetical protein